MKEVLRFFTFVNLCFFLVPEGLSADFQIGRLKYSGGGDWYANPTSIPNWLQHLELHLGIQSTQGEELVTLRDESAWQVPILYATGHGNISFTEIEADNLRNYLISGGFLWVDDNYGMDPYFRKNIQKVFPDKRLVPIGSKHQIYNCYYQLEGLPKIHEHDGKPAQGYAMFHESRMILFYSFSSDIGDGLEDSQVHKNPESVRLLAEKFSVNLVYYVLN